jgi:hypothetical protein
MTTPTLYTLALDFRAAADTLGDLDLPPEAVADTLESLSGDLEIKAQNVALFARNLEATAAAIKDAEAGMAKRRKAIESRVAHLKDYMLAGMMVAGVKKIEGPYLRLSIRDSPEAVEVFDAAQIPAEFMRQPEPPPAAPDKTAIKAAIKAGQEVPGVKLTRSQRLSID